MMYNYMTKEYLAETPTTPIVGYVSIGNTPRGAPKPSASTITHDPYLQGYLGITALVKLAQVAKSAPILANGDKSPIMTVSRSK